MKEEERSRFGLVALGGYVYAVGGYLIGRGSLHSVERYDPDTNSWQLMKSVDMPVPAFPCGISKVVALDGLIYAIGRFMFQEVQPAGFNGVYFNVCELEISIVFVVIIGYARPDSCRSETMFSPVFDCKQEFRPLLD